MRSVHYCISLIQNPGPWKILGKGCGHHGAASGIGADVLAAIRAERLYVLPNREFDSAIRSHAEDLVLQRNPIPAASGKTCRLAGLDVHARNEESAIDGKALASNKACRIASEEDR